MTGRPADFARRLLGWYDASRRDLPWRLPAGSSGTLNPYHVLVSEAMLQQTQVATVVPYFHRFLKRFPTLADLAAADEQEVLLLWQGLGYYSRARNLHAAARQVMSLHAGKLPASADALLSLPGIGRYTAGAVASIAFGQRVPILDGNVQRVLCRVDRIESDPRDRQTQQHLWQRAEEILPKRDRIGDFNSALMELGATVCTPRAPQCLICPVKAHCQAFAAGMQDRIPAPRTARATPLLQRHVYCIERDGQWLIEQRPATGRWAGMWQFITIEPGPETPDEQRLPVKTNRRVKIGTVAHALTHRRYESQVFRCRAKNGIAADQTNSSPKWIRLDDLNRYPFPRPHLKVVELLAVC